MATKKAHQSEQPKPWTVMLYMAASLDERTEQAAIRDLEELEGVTRGHRNIDQHLNLLVQIDRRWPGYAERYCVKNGQSELCDPLYGQRNIRDPGKSSGNPQVLREFVQWGRTNYPAEHCLLVLWGHQYGLGFGRDQGDPLTLPEIASALGGQRIDILGANACAMSYVEAAYELQDAADFLVAPEIAMPMAGWPYDKVLAEIVNNPAIEPKELGEKIVRQFVASFVDAVEPRSVSLALLDLRGARRIDGYLTGLTTEVTAGIDLGKHGEMLRRQIADAFLDTTHADERPLIDLFDLCDRLSAIDPEKLPESDRTGAQSIIAAAGTFRDFLKPGGEFVVTSEASLELEGIHGVGIFAPSVTGAAELMRLKESQKLYEELRLMKTTAWAKLAYQDLKDLLDPVNKIVAEFVSEMGVTNREDRLGLAQLLVSIHRSFVRLEEALGDTQEKVIGVMSGNGSRKARKDLEAGPHRSEAATTAFGWPFLRLVTDLGPSYAVGMASAAGRSTLTAANEARLLEVVAPLAKLEEALANVERTVKRVMTRGRLGLGVPKADLGVPKADLGVPKADLGVPKADLGVPKADMGVPKPDMGVFPWLLEGDGGCASRSDVTSGVTGSYGLVARSLQLVEETVARVENDIRTAMRGEPNGSKAQHYNRLTIAAMKRSFRGLHEVVSSAKGTIIAVLAQPGCGLGPPLQHRERVISRQQLAIAGGLSSRDLRLL